MIFPNYTKTDQFIPKESKDDTKTRKETVQACYSKPLATIYSIQIPNLWFHPDRIR